MAEQEPLLPRHVNDSVSSGPEEELSPSERRKEWLGEYLESKRFHQVVIALITIDAICVLADLSYTFLSDQCSPDHEEEPTWLFVFSMISLVITSLFLIEIPLHTYAFSFQYYNPFAKGEGAIHSSLHLLDAFVIVGTFVIEVFLRGKERELASLLILVRLWRLVKLISGVAVGVGETSEADAKRRFELEAEVLNARAVIEDLQRENNSLKDQIVLLGPPSPEATA